MTLNQLVGIIDGYEGKLRTSRSAEQIVKHPVLFVFFRHRYIHFSLLQLAGDLLDFEKKFERPENPEEIPKGNSRCSAIVKVAEDGGDLLTSHVTWFSYSSLLRLQKRYRFKLCKCKNPGHEFTMSGYPGGSRRRT